MGTSKQISPDGQIMPETSENESKKKTEKKEEEEQVCADPNQPPLSTTIGDPSQNSIERHLTCTIHCYDTKKAAARRQPLCSFLWSRRSKTFKWKIEGFSLLLLNKDIGGPSQAKSNYFSGGFDAHDFTWRLELGVATLKDGKSYISFFLTLVSPPDDLILLPKYQLIIYNLLNNKNSILLKGENRAPFCKASNTRRSLYIVEVEAFKSVEGGFVVNDSCVLGVKIAKVSVLDLQLKRGADLCSSLEEVDYSFSWKVHGLSTFSDLLRPKETTTTQISQTFQTGRFFWHLKLYPKENGSSKEKVKYMSLYLYLDGPSNLLKSSVYVEFYLETKNPINDASFDLKPKVGRHQFTSEAYSWGWPNFLPLPADECIFHLKFTKLGLSENSNVV